MLKREKNCFHMKMDATKSIELYHLLGLNQEEVLDYLATFDQVIRSKRTLKRIFKNIPMYWMLHRVMMGSTEAAQCRILDQPFPFNERRQGIFRKSFGQELSPVLLHAYNTGNAGLNNNHLLIVSIRWRRWGGGGAPFHSQCVLPIRNVHLLS